MTKPQTEIDRLIERLLSHPPDDRSALRERIGEVEETRLRDRLVEGLIDGAFDEVEAALVGQVLAFVGLGERRGELEQIVESPFSDGTRRRSRARTGAFAALMMADDADPVELADRLDLTDREAKALASAVFEATLDVAEFDPSFVRTYGDQLLEESDEEREALFAELESIRRDAGLEAGMLYRRLLEDETYRPLWPRLLEAVVEDANPADADWLQSLAHQVDDEAASRMRRAAMRLRTEGLEDTRDVAGRAYLGTCDGMASFPVFIFVERPGSDRYLGLNLVVRADSGAVRDGFQVADIDELGIQELISQVERDGVMDLTEVPVEVAVGLAQRYLDERSEAMDGLPEPLRDVVTRVERLPDRRAAVPRIESGAGEVEAALEAVEDAAMFDSWFFDPGELEEAGIEFPEEGADLAAWARRAAGRLAADPGWVDRVAAMARHMALWARFGAVEGIAAQFAALAEQVEEAFEESRLVAVLLRRTREAQGEFEALGGQVIVEMLGDASLREELGRRHLGDVDDEAMSEAYSDYMEMVFRTLETALDGIPAPRRPDVELVYALAGTLGRPLAELFCGRSQAPPAATFEHVADTLEEAGLQRAELEWLVPAVLTHADMLADSRGDAGFGTGTFQG